MAVGTPSLNTIPVDQKEFILDKLVKVTLARTLGRPEDVAKAYIYVVKDQFLTGSVVRLDGGSLLV